MPLFLKSRQPGRDNTGRARKAPVVMKHRKTAIDSFKAALSRAALVTFTLTVYACGGGGGGDSTPATTVSGSAAAATSASSASAASAASTTTTSTTTTATGSSSSSGGSSGSGIASSGAIINAARTLPLKPTWTAYYDAASKTDVSKLASTFKMLVIDADPDNAAFTAAQIAQLRAGGTRVLSYLDFGSCENYRSYWTTVPAGFVSCGANTAANLGVYDSGSYGDEYWMNPANPDYQNLIVNYVAPRLAATGVDGFMLDNFEIVGHGTSAQYGPCNAACAQGGLDLIAKLRAKFPTLSIVLNNAPDNARNGTTGGVSFPTLVDGVLAEEVFSSNSGLVPQLSSWLSLAQNTGNSNFFVGTLDYANSCSTSNTATALADWTASKLAGFSPSIATVKLNVVCWWSFLTA